MRGMLAIVFVAGLGIPAIPAIAHGGGLDARGCHTNKKTGEYHCHRPQSQQSSAPQRTEPKDYYRNCAEARAAGVTPLRRGDRGYRRGLDRDDDGIACE